MKEVKLKLSEVFHEGFNAGIRAAAMATEVSTFFYSKGYLEGKKDAEDRSNESMNHYVSPECKEQVI